MSEIKDATKSLTQQQMIVATMCQNQNKDWWLPSDFMKGGEFFVGYEASARLSELQTDNPTMFESKRCGRFIQRRIKFETGREWYPFISTDLRLMVKMYYKTT